MSLTDNPKKTFKGLWQSRLQNVLFLSRLLARKPLFLVRLAIGYFNALVLRRTPLRFMDIAVDYTCNLKCEHCSATIMKNPDAPLITVEEYARFAATLRREGCLIFHFTGGEPFLRKDLEDIIRAFKPFRCGISVQTNGQLVTRERLISLKKVGVDILCVSIDSGIPEEHDAFRRMPGAYEKAVAAITTAKELGFRGGISTCVSHDNLHSEGLKKVIDLAERIGVWCFFNLAVPAGNWRDNEAMLLTAEDREYMERLMVERPHCRTDFSSNFFKWGCGAVKEKLYLTAYGDVMPCPFIQISLGNVRREKINVIRSRALKVSEFSCYPRVCIAAEDREFINKTPCYSGGAKRLPVPYDEIDWVNEQLSRSKQ